MAAVAEPKAAPSRDAASPAPSSFGTAKSSRSTPAAPGRSGSSIFGYPLCHAAERGDVAAIRQAVLRDASLLNWSGRGTGITPLMAAVAGGHRAAVLTLLELRADITTRLKKRYNGVPAGADLATIATAAGHAALAALLRPAVDEQSQGDAARSRSPPASESPNGSEASSSSSPERPLRSQTATALDQLFHLAGSEAGGATRRASAESGRRANPLGYPLCHAAHQGDVAALDRLLQQRVDVNWTGPRAGLTPLLIAAGSGHVRCVELLLRSRADVTKELQEDFQGIPAGATALSIAAGMRKSDIVAALAPGTVVPTCKASKAGELSSWIKDHQQPAGIKDIAAERIKRSPRTKQSPLGYAFCHAIGAGDVSEVQRFLRQGVEVNWVGPGYGITPMAVATSAGHVDIIRLLLQCQARIDIPLTKKFEDIPAGFTCMDIAKLRGHESAVSLLCDVNKTKDSEPDELNSSPPLEDEEQFAMVAMPLSAVTGMDQTDTAPDFGPGPHGDSETGITERPPVRSKQSPLGYAFCQAVGSGEVSEVQRLLRQGVQVNWVGPRYGITPIAVATSAGHAELIQLLLQSRARIDIPLAKKFQDIPAGFTCMDIAALRGHESIVSLLGNVNGTRVAEAIKLKASVPFAEEGQPATVTMSLSQLTGMDQTNMAPDLSPGPHEDSEASIKEGLPVRSKQSPLGYAFCQAVGGGEVSEVQRLLRQGVKVNWVGPRYGITPIAVAASAGHAELTQLLLQCRARIDIPLTKNFQDIPAGFTCMDIATLRGHESVVGLLRLVHETRVAEPDERGQRAMATTALLSTTSMDQTDIAADLNPSPCEDADSAKTHAVISGCQQSATIKDSSAERTKQSPLGYAFCHAIGGGEISEVQRFLRQGVEVNWVGPQYGITPIAVAASAGHAELIQLLLQSRARIDIPLTKKFQDIPAGFTCMDIAKLRGHESAVSLLCDSNEAKVAEPDAFDSNCPLAEQVQHATSTTMLYNVSWSQQYAETPSAPEVWRTALENGDGSLLVQGHVEGHVEQSIVPDTSSPVDRQRPALQPSCSGADCGRHAVTLACLGFLQGHCFIRRSLAFLFFFFASSRRSGRATALRRAISILLLMACHFEPIS